MKTVHYLALGPIALVAAALFTPALAQNNTQEQEEAAQNAREQQAELVLLRAKANLAKSTKLQKRRELAAATERTANAQQQYEDIKARADSAMLDSVGEPWADTPDKMPKRTRAALLANTAKVAGENVTKAQREEFDLSAEVRQAENDRTNLKNRLLVQKRETLTQFVTRKLNEESALLRPHMITRLPTNRPAPPATAASPTTRPLPTPPVATSGQGGASAGNAEPTTQKPMVNRAQLGGLFQDPRFNEALDVQRVLPESVMRQQKQARFAAVAKNMKTELQAQANRPVAPSGRPDAVNNAPPPPQWNGNTNGQPAGAQAGPVALPPPPAQVKRAAVSYERLPAAPLIYDRLLPNSASPGH